MNVEIPCTECGKKIAEYTGPIGMHVPIRSGNFIRIDGTSPEHESSTAHECPHCKKVINELEATLIAVSAVVNPSIPARREPKNEPASNSD